MQRVNILLDQCVLKRTSDILCLFNFTAYTTKWKSTLRLWQQLEYFHSVIYEPGDQDLIL